MKQIPRSALYEIFTTIANAPHGARGELLSQYAAGFSISANALHRKLSIFKKIDPAGRTETRGRKREITDDLIAEVARLKLGVSTIDIDGRQLKTEDCLRLLYESGLSEAGRVSAAQVNKRLREDGFRERPRYAWLEADHPLQIVHADYSRSKFFQIKGFDKKQGDYLLVVNAKHLSYKENNRTLKTWYFAVKDAYSRVARAKVFAATGESPLLAIDALSEWWHPDSEGSPLCYPPQQMWFDRGATAKTEYFKNALNAIGVQLVLVQNKSGQGKIERQFREYWQSFEAIEAIRRFEGATMYLGELNELLNEFNTQQARRQHPLQQKARITLYRQGLLTHPPRKLSAEFRNIAFNVVTRVIDQYGRVSWDGVRYAVPHDIRIGNKTITLAPGTALRLYRDLNNNVVAEPVETALEHPLLLSIAQPEPYNFNDAQNRPRQTPAERLKRTINSKQPILPDTQNPATPDTKSNIHYMSPRPTEITPNHPHAHTTTLSKQEATHYLLQCLAPYQITLSDLRDVLDTLLQNPTREKLDTFIAFVIQKVTTPTSNPRLRAL